MPASIEPLSTNILALMYFGDVVFSLSGALLAETLAFLFCFLMRAAAIVFDIRMGPPGEFIRIGPTQSET